MTTPDAATEALAEDAEDLSENDVAAISKQMRRWDRLSAKERLKRQKASDPSYEPIGGYVIRKARKSNG